MADVPVLAEVAYAAGHLDVTMTAWERVHRSCVASDDQLVSAGAAARVAMHLLFDTALMAPVRAWLRRAERHFEDVGVTATGGELDPLSTGVVECELVCALQGVAQSTSPRSGPRSWSAGARPTPSGASTFGVASTGPRSFGGV